MRDVQSTQVVIRCRETFVSADCQRIDFDFLFRGQANEFEFRGEAIVPPVHAPARCSVVMSDWIVIVVASSVCKNKKQGRGIKRYSRNNTIVES
jgi:hypothetical protein